MLMWEQEKLRHFQYCWEGCYNACIVVDQDLKDKQKKLPERNKSFDLRTVKPKTCSICLGAPRMSDIGLNKGDK